MDVELPRDFREFLASLNSHEVRYLLIGGYAVGYHGYPRATNDIDVWVEVSEENAERIVDALGGFGFGGPDVQPALFLAPRKIIRMGRPPLRIEVATAISGVVFDECFAVREMANLDGLDVPIISRDHLIANKRAAGRPKDIADLTALQRPSPRNRPR
jgi:predicted nucleotidyltransferase